MNTTAYTTIVVLDYVNGEVDIYRDVITNDPEQFLKDSGNYKEGLADIEWMATQGNSELKINERYVVTTKA